MKNLGRIVCIFATPILALVGSADVRGDATPEEIAQRTPPVHRPPGPEYAADARAFQGIPGLERASNGRLWATWYGGGPGEGPENYIMLASSGKVDLFTLHKLLTHKSPQMTQRYAHLRDETLKRASDLAGDIIGSAIESKDNGKAINLSDNNS